MRGQGNREKGAPRLATRACISSAMTGPHGLGADHHPADGGDARPGTPAWTPRRSRASRSMCIRWAAASRRAHRCHASARPRSPTPAATGGGRPTPVTLTACGYTRNPCTGRCAKFKWAVLIVCLGIYYLLPWLRWHRGVNQPDQAGPLSIWHERFYFFNLEFWPQDISLPDRFADHGRGRLVPRYQPGGSSVVRLHLPSDGVDRSFHVDRTPE